MKYTFIFCFLVVLLAEAPLLAQKNDRKVYTAKVGSDKPSPTTKRDKDEVTFQAKNKINSFLDLLGTLTTSGLTELERNSIIQNSYLPNQDQIFFNDEIIIEDDIDPRHISAETTTDLKVERYLRDMDLFYSKTDTARTISFTRIITSPVLEGKDYPYIKAFFTSTFRGKHSQFDVPYRSTQRVAELRAEKIDGKWRTYITRLGFLRPGEGLTELSKPIISESGPKQPITGRETVFQRTGNSPDSIRAKWGKRWLNVVRSSTDLLPNGFYQRSSSGSSTGQNRVSILLTNKDQRLTFTRIDGSTMVFNDPKGSDRLKRRYQRLGWLQIIAGTAALGASYVGYSSLQRSYESYTDQLTTVNAEYAIWQTLTQQPGGNPVTSMPFNSYARPGIYAVYGGAVTGGGLLINGIRYLLKAGKINTSPRK